MKNAVNRNFILVIILALGLLLVPLVVGISVKGIEKDAQEIEEKLEIVVAEGEGYELTDSYSKEVTAYAKMIFWVILIVVGGCAALLFLTAFAAWLVYRNNPQKIKAYRVIMSVNYLLQAVVIYVMVDMLLDEFSIGVLFLTLLVAAGLFYSALYTYSKRICTNN
ncbi:MAG: hypothetical protein IKJ39_03710 [Lachnospiraceae bacterium]|nr:hypothetical protein [Lachnospiraceae bacterium]